MATVIFNLTLATKVDTPHMRKKLLNKWGFTCKAFGVTRLICIADSYIKLKDAEIDFTYVSSLEEALSLVEGTKIVVEQGGTSLKDFNHPEDAIYIFGSDYFKGTIDEGVSINSVIALHADIACGIVLNHMVNG